jgi:hypothetical protein
MVLVGTSVWIRFLANRAPYAADPRFFTVADEFGIAYQSTRP